MNKRIEELISFIKCNVGPIIVDFISSQDFKDAVILPSTIDVKELNG